MTDTTILRFIVPNPPVLVTTLPYVRNQPTLRYEYREPSTIVMHETDTCGATLKYTFRLEDRELVVESCTEISVSGQQVERPSGYTYLRLPHDREKPEEWEYDFHGIRVACSARLDTQEMKGKTCDVIHLTRMFHHNGAANNQPDVVVECYVAGYGLHHRLELSDLKLHPQ